MPPEVPQCLRKQCEQRRDREGDPAAQDRRALDLVVGERGKIGRHEAQSGFTESVRLEHGRCVPLVAAQLCADAGEDMRESGPVKQAVRRRDPERDGIAEAHDVNRE